jgi:predicted alpha/beta superfamily hydrolase
MPFFCIFSSMKTILLSFFLSLSFFISAQKPFVIGEIKELSSKILNEKRILNIYLPEGYDKDTAHYSVIYLLDGGADEDFIHISGLVQFNSFEWISRIPKTIVVGISNTDRKRDFTFPSTVKEEQKKYPTTGGSGKFISFLESELMPFIKANYKINSNATLIGQSLGGLLASEILLKKPTLFDHYMIISPSLWWDNGSLLNYKTDALKSLPNKIRVYIGVGKEGKGLGITNRTMEEEAKLLEQKISSSDHKNIISKYDHLPEEDHATILHQAAMNAFKWLYLK